MEVEVRGHRGIPTTSVLSIRAGRTRRQAHLSQLDGTAFKFPIQVEECGSVKVDILDLCGSARIECQSDVQEYSIPLAIPGDGYTGMEVDLRLTPLADGGGSASGIKLADAETRDGKETNSKAYLEKHGVSGFFHFMIQSLMKDKPDDPYAFLHRQITKKMMKKNDASQTLNSPESQPEDLLAQLSQSSSEWVSEEQLEDLEKKAERASEQLQKDNDECEATAAKMQSRYKALVRAAEAGGQSLAGDHLGATLSNLSTMQNDVTNLTQENTALVGELVRTRKAVQSMQDEIAGYNA